MTCADPESFVRWSNSDIFLVDEGREDPITAESEMPFKWHFAGRPMMVQH